MPLYKINIFYWETSSSYFDRSRRTTLLGFPRKKMHILCLCSKEHYETRNWIRNFNRILSNCWLRIWIWGRRYLQELYYFMGLKRIDPVGKILHHLQAFWRRNAQLMLYAVGLILHSVYTFLVIWISQSILF